MSAPKKVVIVGGGFAGLAAAKELANTGVEVTLVDRKNHHTFQPLLYQVAAGVLVPNQIAATLRNILRKAKNIEILLGEVLGFDLVEQKVLLDGGEAIDYDYLILAAGARHSYFGHDEWEADAPGLKTIEDATNIRRRILLAFEEAERESFLTGKYPPLGFAIVGGGPTGVEVAGMIADIAKRVVKKNYHTVDTTKARVMLFEGSPRVLGVYPADISSKAKSQLEELGVEVHLNSIVKDVEAKRILVNDEWIPVSLSIWATGVAASPLGKKLGVETDRSGRVPVLPDLSLPGHPNLFVVGDMASLKDTKGQIVPGLGAAAIQMGKATSKNILADIKGKDRTPFTYWDKGSMATIGKHRAVAQIGKIHLSGFIAWVAWGLVHIMLLVGFRSRLAVLREWTWAYLTHQSTAQLITGPTDKT